MPPILPAADKTYPKVLMWFRRDLRLADNAALYHALRSGRQVLCAFVFDRAWLDGLPRADRRVEFVRESLQALAVQLRALGGDLIVRHAHAGDELPRLACQLGVQAVFANREDTPAANERDARVRGALANAGIALHTAKDHLVFGPDEVLTHAGGLFNLFTPYKLAWLARLDDFHLEPYPVAHYTDALAVPPEGLCTGVPALAELGFEPSNLPALPIPVGAQGAQVMLDDFCARIALYAQACAQPALRGPSYLGVHLCFGTLSIRHAAGMAYRLAQAGSTGASEWLAALVWREFHAQILAHHPRLAQGKSYQSVYDKIVWHRGKHADMLFAAWCEGRTGYPLVDAAMAQLQRSGYMHHRLRQVVASFLCKDLGLDWRRGEHHFAGQLNDYEPASNIGNWQWASGCGCDALPWYRIFDPVAQSRRLDPEGKFIRRYLPQLAALSAQAIHAPWLAAPVELEAAGVRLGGNYPAPIVDHAQARERTIARYAVVGGGEFATSRTSVMSRPF